MTSGSPDVPDQACVTTVTIAAMVLVLLCGLNSGWVGPILSDFAHEQELTLGQAGAFVGMSGTGSTLSIILAKFFHQKIGPKNSLQLGALMMFLGFGLISLLNHGFELLLAAAFVQGFGMSLGGVSGTLCVLQFAGGSGAVSLNRLHLFYGLGALLGPLAATLALSSPWNYHVLYAGASISSILVSLYLIKVPNFLSRGSQSAILPVVATKPFAVYAAVIFLYVGIEVGLATWLFTYLVKSGQVRPVMASLCMSLLWGGLALGRWLSSNVCAKVLPAKVTMWCAGATILTLLAVTLFPEKETLALVIVALLGTAFGPIYPNTLAEVDKRFGMASGTATPLVILFGAIGAMTFPSALGLVFQKEGMQLGMVSLVVSAVGLALLCTYSLLPKTDPTVEPTKAI